LKLNKSISTHLLEVGVWWNIEHQFSNCKAQLSLEMRTHYNHLWLNTKEILKKFDFKLLLRFCIDKLFLLLKFFSKFWCNHIPNMKVYRVTFAKARFILLSISETNQAEYDQMKYHFANELSSKKNSWIYIFLVSFFRWIYLLS